MLDGEKEFNQQKHLFSSHYCCKCKQQKPCGVLSWERCCFCFYQQERAKAREYSNYQQVYQQKVKERKNCVQQLQLLKNYQGCWSCRSPEIDAYELYENNKLVCQPCLVKKENGSSSPISFAKKSQWYQKHWKINLTEWLTKFQCLPVNADCAKKWFKDKKHLNNCACLKQESRQLHELFASSLKQTEKKLKNCACEKSEKVRVDSDYYTYCEKCEKSVLVASKKRVIKNRNDPKFWGLEIKEKVLCGECLTKFQDKMPVSKKYTFNKYQKRGYWK